MEEGGPFLREDWCHLIEREVETIITISQKQLKPVIVILRGGKIRLEQFQEWRYRFLADIRSRLIAARVPVYTTIAEGARVISKFVDYWVERDRQWN